MKIQSKNTFFFTLLLLFFNVAIVVMSFSYDKDTRLMPLFIGIPTLVLTIFQAMVQFYPTLQKRFEIDIFSPGSMSNSRTRSSWPGFPGRR